MRRPELDWGLVCFCLALVVGACFGGGFVQGLPCESDADCGSQLRCVRGAGAAEGLCGGHGGGRCGNRLIDLDEECDDGNVDDGDGCSSKCLRPRCGDETIDPGEVCDDGNDKENDTCTPECRLPTCGDGFVAPGETCDDGNPVETDECTTVCTLSPEVPKLELKFSQVKQFQFSWTSSRGADYYRLHERANAWSEFKVVAVDIRGESLPLTVPLYLRVNASYKLEACNALDHCVESEVLDVAGSLAEAVGYFKASNTGAFDGFGTSVALSGDGNTLAIGAVGDASRATGIDGDEDDDSAVHAGAVYVFVRTDETTWSQQAYVKASNTGAGDLFGSSVALSRDGNTLAVGAKREDSQATGIDGDEDDDSPGEAGAVYVFVRTDETTWSQQAYVKASNTGINDNFGLSMALSRDGNTLAVGAPYEASQGMGIDGNEDDDSAFKAGAVYVFVRTNETTWSQQAYVKAANTGAGDLFGSSVALSGDGNTLAVGAEREDSQATGIDGDEDDDSSSDAGAAYVFVRTNTTTWSQQAYVKASNTGAGDLFGWSVALSGDGNTLAIGAEEEDSQATGIDGDEDDDFAYNAGAVYVFVRTDETIWLQQAYVKASNTGAGDSFGSSVALSTDGNTLAVGAQYEDSQAAGIDGNEDDDLAEYAGAVYVFMRTDATAWSHQAYVKASNTGAENYYGNSLSLSGEGGALAIGARRENSSSSGIGGHQVDESSPSSGAVYLY